MTRSRRVYPILLAVSLAVPGAAAPNARVADTDSPNSPSCEFDSSLSPDGLLAAAWSGPCTPSGTVAVSTSTDLGSTWGAPVAIGVGVLPKIVASGAGRIDVTWFGPHPTNLVSRRSTDGGATWDVLRTFPLDYNNSLRDIRQRFDVSASGDIAAAGRGPGESSSQLSIVTSTDGGASFRQYQMTMPCCYLSNQIVAWVGGQDLLACWRRSGRPDVFECSTSTDGGLTFEPPRPIGLVPESMTARVAGEVIAAAAGQVTRSTDSGRTWSAPSVLEPGALSPATAANSAGEFWMSFMVPRQTPFLSPGYYLPARLALHHTTDGLNWQRVAPPAALDGCVEPGNRSGGVTYDPSRIHVAAASEVLAEQGRHLWRSRDLGVTWTSPITIEQRPEPTHDALVVELSGGRLLAFWEHRKTTPYELLSSRSTDRGITWSAQSVVADAELSLLDRINVDLTVYYSSARSQVTAVATAAGPVWALWLAGAPGDCAELRASRSPDGLSWEPSIALGHASSLQYSMAEDGFGNLVAAWLDVDLLTSRSTDGGFTWSPPAVLDPLVLHTQIPSMGASPIVSAADGSLVILSQAADLLRAFRTTDGGLSWNSSLIEQRSGPGLSPPSLVSAGPRLFSSRREYTCSFSCLLALYNYESWDSGVSWSLIGGGSVPATNWLFGDDIGNVYWVAKDRLKVGRVGGGLDDLGPLPHATWERSLVVLGPEAIGVFYADWDDPRPGVFYRGCDVTVGPSPLSRRRCVGRTTTFSFSALGFPVTYQWYKDGVPIPGANSSDYTIFNIKVSNAGSYVCRVTNSHCRSESTPALLEVDSGPVVTSSPPSRAVRFGRSTSFSVTVDGDPPLSYQWYHNGVPIPGATSALHRIGVVTNVHAGFYVCTITGPCGLVSSQPAELVVLPFSRR